MNGDPKQKLSLWPALSASPDHDSPILMICFDLFLGVRPSAAMGHMARIVPLSAATASTANVTLKQEDASAGQGFMGLRK